MPQLKLGLIESNRPVKLSIELPAAVYRDLAAYAEAHGQQTGHTALEPAKLISAMLARFMATDRAFAKFRRAKTQSEKTS